MLEDRLTSRLPDWFRGRRAHVARPFLHGVRRWSRLGAMDAFLQKHRDLRGLPLVRAALQFLGADYRVGGAGIDALPRTGPLLVVANHPSGALDALALLDAIGRVRPDVRIVANDVLTAIDGLRPVFLPLDVFGRGASAQVRAIDAALAAGGCVVMFPAGEVARLGWRGVREGRWRDGFARLARRHRAPVVPVRIDARNSALFYGTSAVFKPAATLLLAREMFARRSHPLRLAFGTAMAPTLDAAMFATSVRQRLRKLRFDAERAPDAGPHPVAEAMDVDRVRIEVESLECLGRTFDGKEIRVGRLPANSALMLEIGRLRELTFRAVGEGTGRARDVDRFDGGYDQIVLWDAGAGRIAGGYRVARVADLLAERGLAGLYTATLFRFDARAVARLAAGLELGRSFVVPDYWGSRSVDYLWQGIGAYVARQPWVRYLFGPVSISATLPEAARRDVVAFYARWHGAVDGIEAARPYEIPETIESSTDAETGLRALRARLAAMGASVPMLYKQYVDLCEPGGARFLAFGTDPDFADVIDGFVEVDLERLRPHKRERYLGGRAATKAQVELRMPTPVGAPAAETNVFA
ncbi:lysophospholipid acyltransferase family protein [Lysobacter claricitrinus]|uniref:lysophospholipid acyltransferase family protein n=1 Tax=Lysobacter claricitrinus TaxID=3367728 RepID=UPI0038B2EFBE